MVTFNSAHEFRDIPETIGDRIHGSKGKIDCRASSACGLSTMSHISEDMYSGVLDDIDDALTCLSVSTPRSRLGSEFLFEDIEAIIRSSDHPPVGTTLPPLYPNGWNPEHTLSYSANPNQSGILNQKCGEPLRPGNIRKQGLKRLVNKPIRVLGDSGMVQRRCGDEQMLN